MTLIPSNINNKIEQVAGITPLNDTSRFPTHYADFGYGGLRTADSITDRNSIPLARQVVGMLVYVNDSTDPDNSVYWKLISTAAVLTDANWEELETGSGGGAALAVVEFNKLVAPATDASWITRDGNQVLILDHNLKTNIIDVQFYENGNDGEVFVPWKVITVDQIEGCVPSGAEFAGLVHITSSVASTPNATSTRVDFVAGDWAEVSAGSTTYFYDVVHELSLSRPSTEIYDTNGNEQLLDISLPSTERVRLTVHQNDVFTGYAYVRG